MKAISIAIIIFFSEETDFQHKITAIQHKKELQKSAFKVVILVVHLNRNRALAEVVTEIN